MALGKLAWETDEDLRVLREGVGCVWGSWVDVFFFGRGPSMMKVLRGFQVRGIARVGNDKLTLRAT